jgi:hypothetical protein
MQPTDRHQCQGIEEGRDDNRLITKLIDYLVEGLALEQRLVAAVEALVDLGHGVAAGRHGWISDLSLSLSLCLVC